MCYEWRFGKDKVLKSSKDNFCQNQGHSSKMKITNRTVRVTLKKNFCNAKQIVLLNISKIRLLQYFSKVELRNYPTRFQWEVNIFTNAPPGGGGEQERDKRGSSSKMTVLPTYAHSCHIMPRHEVVKIFQESKQLKINSFLCQTAHCFFPPTRNQYTFYVN